MHVGKIAMEAVVHTALADGFSTSLQLYKHITYNDGNDIVFRNIIYRRFRNY